MTGSTSPLGFPYLTPADNLSDLSEVMQQLAETVDDYLSSLSAVAPAAWVDITPGTGLTGWTGTLSYARRAGMVTLNLEVLRAAFNPGDGILSAGQIPSGFRPGRGVHALGSFGTQIRPFRVNADGSVNVEGLGTQTDGIYGSVTYPV